MDTYAIEFCTLRTEGPHVKGNLVGIGTMSTDPGELDLSRRTNWTPMIDVTFPDDFQWPAERVLLAMYANDRYLGTVLMGPNGFLARPPR